MRFKIHPLIGFLAIAVFCSWLTGVDLEAKTIQSDRSTFMIVGTNDLADAMTTARTAEFDLRYDANPEMIELWTAFVDPSSGNTIDSIVAWWTYEFTAKYPVVNSDGDSIGSLVDSTIRPVYKFPVYVDTSHTDGGNPKLVKLDGSLSSAVMAACDYRGWWHLYLWKRGTMAPYVSSQSSVIEITNSDTTRWISLDADTVGAWYIPESDSLGVGGLAVDSLYGWYSVPDTIDGSQTITNTLSDGVAPPIIPNNATIKVWFGKEGATDELMCVVEPYFERQ